ncbi:NADH-quinone oxidoreductase subunit E [Lentibacter sp. XHP0401]|jgi:NADH-quinone oxidoreductase subunit E|uniref:NADH-quinone oxidoreductase subunit E n=1 Tax=Lentibacter sp. XHP0401 TaxID=2984334 RepID=UPI0021E91A77|nr:NADH-quinone oxidoreductase subunit E [Lentibacter sp. XHP0401]MCV2893945.1 NADH-quinone oxidoreductase subunit E [Lentibacter sp. XHP0401]
MLRRLYHTQPESFAFTPANLEWAEGQITKYPEGRQASAVIPLLWRAQEQEGWVSRPIIETVAKMLGMAEIRVLEVASFYFMFQLQPVGSVAHIQVCGTLSCMICGAEDLIAVCKDKIAPKAHQLSEDGRFSWEEVECLGACSNAPMAQIGKDYYEDLTAENFGKILDELAAGRVPVPGPQNGRYAAEPLSGLTSLTDHESGKTQYNASAQAAVDLGETIKRIDGTEVPILTPWLDRADKGKTGKAKKAPAKTAAKAPQKAALETTPSKAAQAAKAKSSAPKGVPSDKQKVAKPAAANAVTGEKKPRTMSAPRKSGADDLKLISGVGPKLEQTLNELGFWHFDQVAKWTENEIAWVDSRLKFKGRIERDDWMAQAKILAAGGETEFSNKNKKK